MAEIVELLTEDTQEVRVTSTFEDGAPAVESTEVDGLSPETSTNEAGAHRHNKINRTRV